MSQRPVVVIKCNLLLKPEELYEAREAIKEQAAAGIVFLPPGFELVGEVPPGTDFQIITGKPKADLFVSIHNNPQRHQSAAANDCNTCAKRRTCEYLPKWGTLARINCPLWRAGV